MEIGQGHACPFIAATDLLIVISGAPVDAVYVLFFASEYLLETSNVERWTMKIFCRNLMQTVGRFEEKKIATTNDVTSIF